MLLQKMLHSETTLFERTRTTQGNWASLTGAAVCRITYAFYWDKTLSEPVVHECRRHFRKVGFRSTRFRCQFISCHASGYSIIVFGAILRRTQFVRGFWSGTRASALRHWVLACTTSFGEYCLLIRSSRLDVRVIPLYGHSTFPLHNSANIQKVRWDGQKLCGVQEAERRW